MTVSTNNAVMHEIDLDLPFRIVRTCVVSRRCVHENEQSVQIVG